MRSLSQKQFSETLERLYDFKHTPVDYLVEIFSATGFKKIFVPAKRTITRGTEEPRGQREKSKAQSIEKRFSRPIFPIDIKVFLFFGWILNATHQNSYA